MVFTLRPVMFLDREDVYDILIKDTLEHDIISVRIQS
jgi:hypothetical protein